MFWQVFQICRKVWALYYLLLLTAHAYFHGTVHKTTSMTFLNKYIFIILHYLCPNQKLRTSELKS
jgi:hypothetical protein